MNGQGLDLNRAGLFIMCRQREQLENLREDVVASGREAPPIIDLLNQREQPLRAQSECAQHRQRRHDPAGAIGEEIGKQGD